MNRRRLLWFTGLLVVGLVAWNNLVVAVLPSYPGSYVVWNLLAAAALLAAARWAGLSWAELGLDPRRVPAGLRWGGACFAVIAVVYAIGACAMDTGIQARNLEKVLRGLRDDRDTKAIVLRVDSPGGSAIASDLVANQLRRCMERKPVVISQGDVAASGGYWLSMHSNQIVAQPTTVTGSIGVISGWVWDKGLGKKVGMEGDFVEKGEHAERRRTADDERDHREQRQLDRPQVDPARRENDQRGQPRRTFEPIDQLDDAEQRRRRLAGCVRIDVSDGAHERLERFKVPRVVSGKGLDEPAAGLPTISSKKRRR